MGFYNTPTVINQIRENKVKGLAVTSLGKSALTPALPTLDSSGVKDYEVNTWFGFVAPAGTPPEIVARLHNDIAKIIAMPAVKEKLAAQGFDLVPVAPPSSFSNLIREDLAKWAPIVKASGAKVD
jgi:tripartite-type tricarboxylate transporter receptor subunit TctC